MFQQLCHPDQLYTAWKHVRANGAATGGDGETAAAFSNRIELRLRDLANQLQSGKYRPGPLSSFSKQLPGGKTRILRIPGIADRVAQTACQKLLSKHLDKRMSQNSFGYRPARSVTKALERLGKLSIGNHWVLDADIASFFDQVSHERLLDELGIWVGDARVISLVATWLRSFGSGRSLAQGSPISPVLANLYLHPLDMTFARNNVPQVRYADDFVALAQTKRGAENARKMAEEVLHRRELELNPDKTGIVLLSDGLHFLGKIVYPASRCECSVKLDKSN